MKFNLNIKNNSNENIKVIYWILALSPLIDIIYTINVKFLNIDFPIQQIIRALIVLYLFWGVKQRKNKLLILFITFVLGIGQIYMILNNYNYNLISNFSYILKIISLFTMVIYIKEKLNLNKISVIKLINSIKVSALILSLNIIISNIFKVGLKTYNYGNRAGYKGFIEAHNDVTVVLLMILPLVIYMYLKNKDIKDLILSLIIACGLFLIGPKAGKILLLFELILFIVPIIKKIKFNKYVLKVMAFLFIAFTLIIVTNLSEINLSLNKYVKDKGYKSVYSYVVSHRDIQPRLIDNGISNDFDIHPKYLFGMGYSYANDVLNEQKKDFFSIENDFEGLIYYSGVFTAAIILYFIFKNVFIALVNKKNDMNFKYFILVSMFIGLIHSFLGGHVIYSAIANTYFAVILALGGIDKDKIICSE